MPQDRSTGRCIYCPKLADAKEHWLPRGLGKFKGYQPLLDRLCTECNELLGREVDQEFLRTGEIGFQRAIYGIDGRPQHHKVNAFHYRAASTAPPTTARMPAWSGDHELLAEFLLGPDGQPAAKPLRQVVVKTGDTIRAVPFPRGWAAEQLGHALSERGIESATPIEVYLDVGEEMVVEGDARHQLLRSVFGPFKVTVFGGWGSAGHGEVRQLPASAEISRTYVRGVVKTGFHYFLWASNIFRGDEPCFEDTRNFVRHDAGDWELFVQFEQPSFLNPLNEGHRLATLSHLLLSQLDSNEVSATLHFFLGPLMRTPRATHITLARQPPLLFKGTRRITCHHARYLEVEGHNGDLIAVDVWDPRIIQLT